MLWNLSDVIVKNHATIIKLCSTILKNKLENVMYF